MAKSEDGFRTKKQHRPTGTMKQHDMARRATTPGGLREGFAAHALTIARFPLE